MGGLRGCWVVNVVCWVMAVVRRSLSALRMVVDWASTSQSPTDSCRTHRIPEDSPGFLRIPQDSSIILMILSW